MSVAGVNVEILVNGGEAGPELRRITVAFERAGDELGHLIDKLAPKLGAVFEAEERRQFDSSGGGPGGSWAPLSPAYEKWKAQKYPGQGILRARGNLYEALTSSSSPFAQRVATGDEFEFGTVGVPYASFHQLGTATMPARPEFDMSSDFERDLQEVTLQTVREVVQASGLAEFVEGP